MYVLVSILPQTPLLSRLPQDIGQRSLCRTVGPSWLPLKHPAVILTDHLDVKKAGELSTLFDVGGIFGEFVSSCPTLTKALTTEVMHGHPQPGCCLT